MKICHCFHLYHLEFIEFLKDIAIIISHTTILYKCTVWKHFIREKLEFKVLGKLRLYISPEKTHSVVTN